MFVTKVKTPGAIAVTLAVFAGGSGVIMCHQHAGAQPPAKQKAEPPQKVEEQPDPVARLFKGLDEGRLPDDFARDFARQPVAGLANDKVKALLAGLKLGEKMNSLLKEQYKAARIETQARWNGFLAGRETMDIYIGASTRLLQSELELSNTPDHRLNALTAHWKRMKDLEAENKDKFDNSRVAMQDYLQSRFARARAEIWLERAKAGVAVNLNNEREIPSPTRRGGF